MTDIFYYLSKQAPSPHQSHKNSVSDCATPSHALWTQMWARSCPALKAGDPVTTPA